jgi:NAD dependent epimerase/dehydratase family enzyme
VNEGPIILAGGGGFLGRVLADWFAARNREVVVLTRSPRSGDGSARYVGWDGRTLGTWTAELENAGALINLAGRSVNCRYHARNRREILRSRVDSTRILGEAISRSGQPPRVWLNSSTATIYKHSIDRSMDEATGIIGATREAKD